MEHYSLIGYPLGHSMSPQIHERLFRLGCCEADYELTAFPPESFAERIESLKRLNGFNITIPYKRTIIPYLDELDDSARLYGAVNTVWNKKGIHIGFNTDAAGFLRTMSSHDAALDTRVCVLGAGGVGRMFAIECVRQGGDVTVAVRETSRQKATELANEIQDKLGKQINVCDIGTLDGSFDLLINATPVGMFPKTDASPVPKAFISQCRTVFDCIYNPSETLLLRHARECGCKTIGGMDMLVWQAAAAHEIWCGCCFNTADINTIIYDVNRLLPERERPA